MAHDLSMRPRIARLALLLAFVGSAPAFGGTIPRDVGGVSIHVTVPGGFVNAEDVSAELQRTAETMTLRGNRTLLFMVRQADVERFRKLETGASFQEYLSVQYPLHREGQLVSLSYFAALKQYLKDQAKNVFAAARPEVQKQLDQAGEELGSRLRVPDLRMKQGESVPLGPFDERTNSISMVVLSAFDFTANGQTEQVAMAMTMTVAIVKGKMIYLYAYAPFDDGAGLPKIRQMTTAWVNEFLEANAE
jgi:hypothetical protein